MRTKTLLLTAAVIAAGLVSSFAQSSNVYSVNVVGYYNITVPAAKKSFVSMQLPGGTAGNDTLVNNTFTNGVPDGSSLGFWNGSGFVILTYFAGFGWFDDLSNFATNRLAPGQGALFINGDIGAPATVTVVGQVPQGSFTNAVTTLRNFYSIPTPIATNIDSTLANFPSQDGDSYLQWNVANQNYDGVLTYFAGFGWFDDQSVQRFPTPNVGTSFLYVNSASAQSWVFNFTVQ